MIIMYNVVIFKDAKSVAVVKDAEKKKKRFGLHTRHQENTRQRW